MRFRIALWASVGFVVGCCWAFVVSETFPSTNQVMRSLWILVTVTCPIAVLGRHYPISLVEMLVANTLTYGLVGLAVEIARKQLHREH